MVPYKRPAADKSGVPVYQPNATTYQQLMQLQQPFVPVSCEYSASPTPTPATTTATPPATTSTSTTSTTTETQVIPTTLQQQLHQQQQQQQQQLQIKKDSIDVSSSIPIITNNATITTTSVPIPIQSNQHPDPNLAATLAKEVAQQNYAKAVKLAAANHQSYANPLNPLNYTGVSLNKQAMNVPPPTPAIVRYPSNYGLGAATALGTAAALSLGFANPYAAASIQQQASLLNLSRSQAATPSTAALMNPYAFIRTPYATVTHAPQMLGTTSLLGTTAQYHPHHHYHHAMSAAAGAAAAAAAAAAVGGGTATSITNVPATTQITVAAAQNNNNNNVVLQPYKKLKTT